MQKALEGSKSDVALKKDTSLREKTRTSGNAEGLGLYIGAARTEGA